MNRKRLLPFMLGIVLFLVMGYRLVDTVKRNLPVTCDEIIDPRLNQIPTSNVDAVTIQQWFASQYGISKDQIFIIGGDPSSPPPKLGVRWQSETKWYEATIDTQSKQLEYVDIDWKTRVPTVEKLLSCNGEPEYYTLQRFSSKPPYDFQLTLWYPRAGFIISGAQIGNEPTFNNQSQLDKLRLLREFDIRDTSALSNTKYFILGSLSSNSIKKWTGVGNFTVEDMTSGK